MAPGMSSARIGSIAATLCVGLAAAAAAAAQTAPSVTVPQLSKPERGGAALAPADAAAPASARRSSDLTTGAAQVGEARPTAEPPPPLSSRAESRAVGSARIGGTDRCDAQARGPEPAICDHPIEARAADYVAPGAAALTAEARLLILSQRQGSRVTTPSTPGDLRVDNLTGATAAEIAATVSQTSRAPGGLPEPATSAGAPGVAITPGSGPLVLSPH